MYAASLASAAMALGGYSHRHDDHGHWGARGYAARGPIDLGGHRLRRSRKDRLKARAKSLAWKAGRRTVA
jgi:acyl-coenzyme A thioesterase PaaI-like protein